MTEWRFRGVSAPNYTQFPNDLFTEVMPNVSPTEWMVVCYVVRKTVGWHTEEAPASLRELAENTSISRSAIATALRSLVAHGVLKMRQNKAANGGSLANSYGLAFDGGVSNSDTPPDVTRRHPGISTRTPFPSVKENLLKTGGNHTGNKGRKPSATRDTSFDPAAPNRYSQDRLRRLGTEP